MIYLFNSIFTKNIYLYKKNLFEVSLNFEVVYTVLREIIQFLCGCFILYGLSSPPTSNYNSYYIDDILLLAMNSNCWPIIWWGHIQLQHEDIRYKKNSIGVRYDS